MLSFRRRFDCVSFLPFCQGRSLSVILSDEYEDVQLVEFVYVVFTRMPGESYRGRLRSLSLCLCDVFRALINSLVC